MLAYTSVLFYCLWNVFSSLMQRCQPELRHMGVCCKCKRTQAARSTRDTCINTIVHFPSLCTSVLIARTPHPHMINSPPCDHTQRPQCQLEKQHWLFSSKNAFHAHGWLTVGLQSKWAQASETMTGKASTIREKIHVEKPELWRFLMHTLALISTATSSPFLGST